MALPAKGWLTFPPGPFPRQPAFGELLQSVNGRVRSLFRERSLLAQSPRSAYGSFLVFSARKFRGRQTPARPRRRAIIAARGYGRPVGRETDPESRCGDEPQKGEKADLRMRSQMLLQRVQAQRKSSP